MKLKIGVVLLAALAIELVNFFLLAFPIDVGYPPNTPWYIQVIGLQWVALHLLGLFSLSWFEKIFGCNQLNIVMGCGRVDSVVLFAGGYLTTVLLAFAVTYGFQQILRLRRRLSTRSVLGAISILHASRKRRPRSSSTI
jgi:hypothetical protein